jgi:hypothetical protein
MWEHSPGKGLLIFLFLFLIQYKVGAAPIILEAEDGVLTGTTVANSRPGYTGSGYVSGFDAGGDKLAVTINTAAAGSYTLSIRYASPYGDKTNDIHVNGSLLVQQVFTTTTVFQTLEIGSIILQAGANTIEIRHNWGYFDVDNISLTPPAASPEIVLQAEEGTLTGTEIATTRPGFTGTGYVTGFDASGDKLTLVANAPTAGDYQLSVSYASPYGDKTNDIYVNGVLLVRQVFTQTNDFQNLEIGTVSLAAGPNTIEIRHNWGYFDVDKLKLTPPAVPFPPSILLEAEEGTLAGTAVANTRSGYSGTGYVTGFDTSGDKVTVTTSSPAAATYSLSIRYASEYGDKTNDVYVNGMLVANQVFPQSAAFTTLMVQEINLVAGTNTIEIRHNWGYFDVDNFTLALVGGGGNTAPKAEAGEEQVKVVQGSGTVSFTLDASASSDAENNIVSFEWTKADGTAAGTASTVETGPLAIGEYEYVLTVTDEEGLSSTDRVKLFVGEATNWGNNRIRFRQGEDREVIFASGINLAWRDFSKDLDYVDEANFTQVLDQIQAAGGNTLRWWLHTNGRFSPDFGADGRVTGIDHKEITNMRRVLDMTYERGIAISMCLWSFDMLQPQGQDQNRMKNLLEDPAITQTYIDNALIPLLEEIGDHPAVLSWEIFNEGEGATTEFGWTPVRSQMRYVQQFTNLLAGAIHRTVPGALVSTSSWSFTALTDKDGNYNYYSDARLVAAGGDPEGTLDFYQIHFYPQHYGNNKSPFHRPASYWGLDKPILIGEFPETGVQERVDPHLTTLETYQRAYALGYAGALAWDFRGYKGNGFEDIKESLTYLAQNHPEDIHIGPVANFNYAPEQVAAIPDARLLLKEHGTQKIEAYVALDTIFRDAEDATALLYTIQKNSNESLVKVNISEEGVVSLDLAKGATGTASITVRATDSGGAHAYVSFMVIVKDPMGNLALFMPVTSSSNESSTNSAVQANDGDRSSRWSSSYEDKQWIYVDLGKKLDFDLIKLYWEIAYAKAYAIEVSDDAIRWTTISSIQNSDGGRDSIAIAPVKARFVRVLGLERATGYGISLWELEVYDSFGKKAYQSTAGSQIVIMLYPNPVKGFFRIKTPLTNQYQLIVFDFMGNIRHSQAVTSTEVAISTQGWNRGVYLVQLNVAGELIQRRLVVE